MECRNNCSLMYLSCLKKCNDLEHPKLLSKSSISAKNNNGSILFHISMFVLSDGSQRCLYLHAMQFIYYSFLHTLAIEIVIV